MAVLESSRAIYDLFGRQTHWAQKDSGGCWAVLEQNKGRPIRRPTAPVPAVHNNPCGRTSRTAARDCTGHNKLLRLLRHRSPGCLGLPLLLSDWPFRASSGKYSNSCCQFKNCRILSSAFCNLICAYTPPRGHFPLALARFKPKMQPAAPYISFLFTRVTFVKIFFRKCL